jgi:Holliday junction resolvase RusA-like endonuclease
VKITLPWPAAILSPNARAHWSKVRPAKAKARADANTATQEACQGGMREVRAAMARQELIALQVTFYPPDKRNRDQDNMVASLIASMNGIADALACNDAKFRAVYFIGDAEKPGRVEVEI